MNNKQFVVMRIGCLECRNDSTLLGIFNSLGDAKVCAEEDGYIKGGLIAGEDYEAVYGEVQTVIFPHTTPTTSNINNELDEILNNLDISNFPNRGWSDSAKQALTAYIERECLKSDYEARIDELNRLFDGYDADKRIKELVRELVALIGGSDD